MNSLSADGFRASVQGQRPRYSLSSVAASASPPKYLASASANTEMSGRARENSVSDGTELLRVDRAENLRRCLALDLQRQLDAFAETRAEDRMVEVGPRLVERANGVKHRCRAEAEAGNLGKNEPHPVRPLLAGPSSRTTLAYTEACASRKRCRLKGSLIAMSRYFGSSPSPSPLTWPPRPLSQAAIQ